MLHELLLALSGHPSSLLSPSVNEANNGPLQDLLSPAETALLRSLAQDLGEKHKNVRERATRISATHSSIVCRAVSTAIISSHLAKFQQKILEVEQWILEENSRLVGAYNIVPLSGLVGEFDGWARKLEWLWSLAQFIQPDLADQEIFGGQQSCTARQILERLRESTHTGYPDIEQISLQLTKVAEGAWLKQVSAWVLYGRLPTLGATDFFITRENSEGKADRSTDIYYIKDALVPTFVTPSTANSVFFIGKSLNHIRDKRSLIIDGASTGKAPELELLPLHLAHLSTLGSPISPSTFSASISAIRLSLSKNALQKLLPQVKVLELLRILKDFFLLERGEFAIALVSAADERLAARHNRFLDRPQQKGYKGLGSMVMKEGEVFTVLARTWTTLSSLQDAHNDDDVDDDLDLARELIRLMLKPHAADQSAKTASQATDRSTPTFDDFLLPTPTTLTLRVPSPLDLLFSPANIETYSRIHAYLLSIRHAHVRLTQLFLLSALRRSRHELQQSETHQRIHSGAKSMRSIWAAIGSVIFLLAELSEYFQGQIIQSSWSHFHNWLDLSSSPSSSTTLLPSSSPPPSSNPNPNRVLPPPPHDPETLSKAHTLYLAALTHRLLLTHVPFSTALHDLLRSTAQLCALTQRLAVTVQVGGDVGEQEEVQEELRLEARGLETRVKSLVEVLREVDRGRGVDGRGSGARGQYGEGLGRGGGMEDMVSGGFPEGEGGARGRFVPWAGWGVERLLLKLDWVCGEEVGGW